MDPLFILLRALGEAVITAIGGGIAGKALCELPPAIARNTWTAWSGQADETRRRAEIEALGCIEECLFRLPIKAWDAAEKPLLNAIGQTIQAVAAEQPPEFQKQLSDYLREIPRALRHRLPWSKGTANASAIAAVTVEEKNLPRAAGDVLAWLPNWLPLHPADLARPLNEWLPVNLPGANSEADTLTLDLGADAILELVRIPAGEFIMGSPESEEGHQSKETQHPVKISRPFYVGKYEVTQRQWAAFMPFNPSAFVGDDLPVENLFWFDCLEFCRRLGREVGLCVRPPTEAEWEYACRAGTTTPYWDGHEIRTKCANFDGTFYDDPDGLGGRRESTTPVDSFAPNRWGLHDMHGNVAEWCLDWLGEYPSGEQIDPRGPANGAYRVLRGGSWSSKLWECRSAARTGAQPNFYQNTYGFRIVVETT